MIVVGYSADPFGRAALEHGIAEAKLRGSSLRVVNSTAGDAYVDAGFAQPTEVHDIEEHLANCGVEFELTQPAGVDAAGELLETMARRRRRASGHRHQASQSGGQAAAWQCFPAAPAGMPQAGARSEAAGRLRWLRSLLFPPRFVLRARDHVAEVSGC